MASHSPEWGQKVLDFGNGKLTGSKTPSINPQPQEDPARVPLEEIAKQMRKILPGILLTRPDAQPRSRLYGRGEASPLDVRDCPKCSPTTIKVANADTIDVAIRLAATTNPSSKNVCVLNMANAHSAGGGWMHGALAQEEVLCYRSSLSATLKYNYYPLPEEGGIYSPRVLVLRKSMKDGHGLLDLREPKYLPVISVISVAAICQPPTVKNTNGQQRYASSADAALMQEKMKVILRIAATNGHRQLVLGALGCGAFGNPKEEVAGMWKAVLSEPEFAGGWWQDIVFAVFDVDGRGNFQTFYHRLDGHAV